MPPRKREVPPINFNKIAEETDMAFGNRKGGQAVETPAFQEPTLETKETPVVVETTESAPTKVEETDTPRVDAIRQEHADAVAKRTRPPITLGNVVVRKSTRTDFSTRATPTESNPVFVAVKDAELDTPTDILVENTDKKIQGALSILRRAGAKLSVGMHIAPKRTVGSKIDDVTVGSQGYPVEEVGGVEYAVITFKTSSERQDRKGRRKKTEVAATAE